MSWINQVSDILHQYKGASASTPPSNAPEDFAKVAERAPASDLSSGLTEAFRAPNAPPFAQMVAQLFGQSDGEQRAGILNHLLAAAAPAAQSGSLPGSLTRLLSGSRPSVSPEQAQQIPPDAVQQLAE